VAQSPDPDIERLIEDAKMICAVPAPTFAEAQRAAFVRERFAQLGAAAELDAVGNVVCAFGPAEGDAVVFGAHLDTVFPAEQPIVIDHDRDAERISAPGIGDNSLAVAALLALARDLNREPPSTRVVLAATVGEEGLGDLRGAKHLLDTVACRAFVAVEGAMLDAIKHAGVGSTRYRVTYRGPGGHSWTDRGAPSALHGLVEVAAAFLAQPAPAGVGRNIGRLDGGTSINTIAASASLELDLRAEHAEPLAAAAAQARARFCDPPDGLRAEVELIGERPSGGLPSDHPLLEAARRARRAAGLAPAAEGASSTDANAAYGRGIPAVTVGLSTGANGHRVDEYIDLAPLPGGMRALRHLTRELAGARRASER
jgi:acetylornithine deacetylase/succinyl-diaminopimelate desuccinylase-like protein